MLPFLLQEIPRKTIAKKLGIAEGTVAKHIARVHKKLDVHDGIALANRVFDFYLRLRGIK